MYPAAEQEFTKKLSHPVKFILSRLVPLQCPADFIICCFLQNEVVAQKGMALIAAAANQVAKFPEVEKPMVLV